MFDHVVDHGLPCSTIFSHVVNHVRPWLSIVEHGVENVVDHVQPLLTMDDHGVDDVVNHVVGHMVKHGWPCVWPLLTISNHLFNPVVDRVWPYHWPSWPNLTTFYHLKIFNHVIMFDHMDVHGFPCLSTWLTIVDHVVDHSWIRSTIWLAPW